MTLEMTLALTKSQLAEKQTLARGRGCCQVTPLWLVSALGLASQMLAGCGTLPNGRGWGQDATISPGWDRVRAVAWRNATDPWTWAPIAGAVVLQVDDLDERISDWARDETPVFGSQRKAEDASNSWRQTSDDLWLISVLATRSGESPTEWVESKTRGLVVEVAAKGASRVLTSVLKGSIGRERPRRGDDRSFPSGHMTEAYGNAVLASRNLESTDLPAWMILPARVGVYTSAIGTGWARVEAGAHFPADVLFAAGATNFITGVVHDAFLGLDVNPSVVVSRGPEGEGWFVGLFWSF